MRRLRLRWVLWLNDVCPEHGDMEGMDMDGHTYCEPCRKSRHCTRQAKLERYRRELRGYYCEKCGHLYPSSTRRLP